MNRLISLNNETMTADRFEARMEEIKTAIKRYREIEQSEELKEFYALKKIIETPEFQQKKNFLLKRKYSETEEGKIMRQYRRAAAYPSTQKYLAIAKSDLRNRWIFKMTQAWRLTLPFVRRYLQLDKIVNTEDFKQRNAFWRNPKRWYTTEESKQDGRYLELKESEDLKFFLEQDPKQIESWEKYSELWADEFDWMTMKESDWRPGFYYANKALKADHSYFNEQQANNKGMNSFAVNSVLTVEVKPDFVHATAWDNKRGFVEKEYTFTGDVIQTAEKFSTEEGLFLAKVRAEGLASSALYLATDERLPILTMMHWNGKHVTMGMKNARVESTVTVKGLKAHKWVIYGLRITSKELIWYVNGQEVNREVNFLRGRKVYPAIAAYLPEKAKAGIGQIDVDWIRVYKFNG